jgi:glycosyltransferase involved in cell wall biosynthesis
MILGMPNEMFQLQTVSKRAKPVLYLSPDGMLEPLGEAQVISYIIGLSLLGYGYEILSLEKEEDRRNSSREGELRKRLDAGGICWTALTYDGRSMVRLARTYMRAWLMLRKRWKSRKFGLVHARSYLMGLLARQVANKRYLYDARGYWVDERKEAGRWFGLRPLYSLGKRLELKVAQDAAAIITLTDLQRDDFRALLPGKVIVTITTCVDFSRFRPDPTIGQVPEAARCRLEGKLVLGLMGSVSGSYRIQDSIRLFRFVRTIEPSAHLLCLTRQKHEVREYLSRGSVAEDDFTIASVPHSEMHEWMSLAHWGLILLEESFAKRASMPTKLGEMFASGVRPVQYGCNEEVARLVLEAGSGIVLPGLNDDDLRAAAAQIVSIGKTEGGILQAREKMRARFSLEAGTMRYASLLANLMNCAQPSQGRVGGGK